MRTTLQLDDDILMAARSLAHSKSTSIGKALSDLARKGLKSDRGGYSAGKEGDLPVFRVREDSPPITPEQIKSAEDEL
jgi:hypothetical protein